ncbi:MAG: substrate-binding domain-containing protein [Poseidonibacter sp.]|uniref:substrate-binding domain-containing protein n=1 Tax=Poseidonibacter sp. TaxID=2321188 RepID=UPI00359EF7D8
MHNNSLKKLFVFMFLINILWAGNKDYFGVQEFIDFSNQQTISDDFIEIIQKDAQEIKKQDKKVRIVLVYPGKQLTDYWIKSKVSFEKRLNELGIKYELIMHSTKPHVEIKKQSVLLAQAIKEKTDYLIFVLDANKHAKFIERIISKKTPKLILQNITTPLRRWEDRQPFLYVGFDHMIGSQMLADYYIKKTNGKGKYAVLYTSNGYIGYMRGTKFIDYVSKNSDLEVIHEYYTHTSKENAKNATLDLLALNDDIKFIYACSTDIALGVIEALKEKNLTGKILVNGWGGGSSELQAIEDDLLDVTVMRMNDDNGVAMAEAIKLDLEDKEDKIPTIFSGKMVIVDKDIKKEELKKLRERAFRYTFDVKE